MTEVDLNVFGAVSVQTLVRTFPTNFLLFNARFTNRQHKKSSSFGKFLYLIQSNAHLEF